MTNHRTTIDPNLSTRYHSDEEYFRALKLEWIINFRRTHGATLTAAVLAYRAAAYGEVVVE